jgi:hypothetical protein
VVVGHHDDWMPPVTNADFDMEPVRRELALALPSTKLVQMGYLKPVDIL